MDIHLTNHPSALQPLRLAARTASRHYIWSAPDDLDQLYLALKRGDCHFRVPAHLVPSGVWVADIAPGHVPEPTESHYEVFGLRGENPVYLGRGKLTVEETCCDGEAIESIQAATLMPLYDEAGLVHTLKVVQLENGDYTLQLD